MIIILLLTISIVVADSNITFDQTELVATFVPQQQKVFTSECREQFNNFFTMQPEVLVKNYCNAIQTKVIWIFVLAGLMWLFEPVMKKLVQKKKIDTAYISVSSIFWIYKVIGIGIMFIGCYALYKLT